MSLYNEVQQRWSIGQERINELEVYSLAVRRAVEKIELGIE